MTKKEQAAFDELEHQVASLQSDLKWQVLIAKALRWTGPVAPDVAPPAYGKLSKGFMHNRYTGKVSPACSSSTSHCATNDMATTSQKPIWLYSTRARALQAMRHELEDEFARRLAAIDKQIEQELA